MALSENTYIKTKDYLVSKETFKLQLDETFDMLVTHPKPNPADLAGYYESDAYISHTDNSNGVLSFLYQIVKKYSLRKKVTLVNSLQKNKGKLLDVGAGTGDFLVTAKSNGWKTFGVEVNACARNRAAAKAIDLATSLDDFKEEKFNVITLWHVLEHISDLQETISKLENLLVAKGTLIIAVPNYKSYDAQYYKEHWAAYDVPRHLWHFSRNSIPKLCSNAFSLKKTKPMVFDAFYVSLLSEKYKTGASFSLRAFWVGLRSNIKAWRTKEYSSVIYCLKKMK